MSQSMTTIDQDNWICSNNSTATTEATIFDVFDGDAYECRVLLCPEPEGGLSAYAIRLEGVKGHGDTVEESLANLEEAFTSAILSYLRSGEAIPWGTVADLPSRDGCFERWILVKPDFRDLVNEITPNNEVLKNLANKFPASSKWCDEG